MKMQSEVLMSGVDVRQLREYIAQVGQALEAAVEPRLLTKLDELVPKADELDAASAHAIIEKLRKELFFLDTDVAEAAASLWPIARSALGQVRKMELAEGLLADSPVLEKLAAQLADAERWEAIEGDVDDAPPELEEAFASVLEQIRQEEPA